MKKKSIHISFMIFVSVLLLMTALTGCSKDRKIMSSSSDNMIPGTWQTASMGYEYYGTDQAEYYVRFTNSEIIYGHMKDGEFVSDHSDRIIHLEKITADEFKVQAESSNGSHYTYLTCKSDHGVLEYYGTWNEENFPDTYSIGASLSRCS